jgi:hypothetical protein
VRIPVSGERYRCRQNRGTLSGKDRVGIFRPRPERIGRNDARTVDAWRGDDGVPEIDAATAYWAGLRDYHRKNDATRPSTGAKPLGVRGGRHPRNRLRARGGHQQRTEPAGHPRSASGGETRRHRRQRTRGFVRTARGSTSIFESPMRTTGQSRRTPGMRSSPCRCLITSPTARSSRSRPTW